MFNIFKPKIKFDESIVSFLNDTKTIKEFYISYYEFSGEFPLTFKVEIGGNRFKKRIEGKTIEEVLIKGKAEYEKIKKVNTIVSKELKKLT